MPYHLSNVRIREKDVSFTCSSCKRFVRFDYDEYDFVFRRYCIHCHSIYDLKKLVKQYNGGMI